MVVKALSTFAYPTYLSRRNAGHEGMVLDIGCYHGTCGNHGIASHGVTAHHRTVGTQRGSRFYERFGVDSVYREVCPRCQNVGENTGGTTENIVFQFDAFIDADVVLNAHTVTDADVGTYVNVLPQRTVTADTGALLNVAKVPYFSTFAQLHAFIYIGGFVYVVVFLFHGSVCFKELDNSIDDNVLLAMSELGVHRQREYTVGQACGCGQVTAQAADGAKSRLSMQG